MSPPAGINGILPVSVLQKNAPVQPPRGPKAAQPRLKLVCRRLPPGLTRAEFEAILGDEWTLGAGKLDWLLYRKGNISTDAAKPSRPARAYLHVTRPEYVKVLGDLVRAAIFQDAAKSWQDATLVGLPTLEYAPYPKMPGGRRRNDNRQGTIDQDQEFKDFLESLTNPITKPPAADNDAHKEKVKTTPLIEALREKKANRDKPNTKANRQARGDAKDEVADRAEKKVLAKPGKENTINPGDKNRRPGKADKAQATKEQATKEAVKILNKEASSSRSTPGTAPSDRAAASPAPERKRGNVALAKSMLQRDLGVGPAPNRRRGTKREVGSAAADAGAQVKETRLAAEEKAKEAPVTQSTVVSTSDKAAPTPKKERPTRAERRAFKASLSDKAADKPVADARPQTPVKAPAPQILKKPQSTLAPNTPKGPAAFRAPPTAPPAPKPYQTPVQASSTKSEAASSPLADSSVKTVPATVLFPASKQAFLKHANPSQGITESLIEETLKAFGAIEKVEIDKRKGFAYVDFAESVGLRNAMAASPIKIAQGAVQVLERKEKPTRPPRFSGPPTGPQRGGGGGRGAFPPRGRGRGSARGGSHIVPGSAAGATDNPATVPVVPLSVPAFIATADTIT